jgi:hypothetical protein
VKALLQQAFCIKKPIRTIHEFSKYVLSNLTTEIKGFIVLKILEISLYCASLYNFFEKLELYNLLHKESFRQFLASHEKLFFNNNV